MKKIFFIAVYIFFSFQGFSQNENSVIDTDNLHAKNNDFQNAIGLTFYNDNVMNNFPFPGIHYIYNIKIININQDMSLVGRTKIAITPYYPSIEYYPFTFGLSYGHGSGTFSQKSFGIYTNVGFGYYVNFGYYESYLGLKYEIGLRYNRFECGFSYIDDLDYKKKQYVNLGISYIFLTKN